MFIKTLNGATYKFIPAHKRNDASIKAGHLMNCCIVMLEYYAILSPLPTLL